MAAGKSTAGRALASLLRWRFVDLDAEIERLAKKSIADIFSEGGEAEFRRAEAGVLRLLLQCMEAPTVIALGGGTFVQPDNAEGLRQRGVRVVFLELPLEQLLKRCHGAVERDGGNPRPLAVNEGAFRALYAQRLPFYRNADLTVDVQDKAPEEIAHEIAKRLRVSDYAGSL